MVRMNVYFSEDSIKFLKSQEDISIAEHARRAMDQYIEKLQSEKASSSASKLIKSIVLLNSELDKLPVPQDKRHFWDAKTNKTYKNK